MAEFNVNLTGNNTDLRSKLIEVLEAMNKVGQGTGLETFGSKVVSFLTNPLTAVSAALAGVVALLRSVLKEASEIVELSIRANLSTRQSAALQDAAERVGGSPDQVGGALNRLRRAQAQAVIGGPTSPMAQSLKALGLTMEDITKSNSFDLFSKLLDKLKDGPLSAEQLNAGMRIFRFNLQELQVLAAKGLGEEIRDALKDAPTDETVNLLNEITLEASKKSKATWQNFKQDMMEATAGVIKFIAHATIDIGVGTKNRLLRQLAAITVDQAFLPPTTSAAVEKKIDEQTQKDAEKAKAKQDELARLTAQAKILEESAKGFTKITPDKFAKMGLFLSTGTEKLTNELIALNKQSVAELKAIKASIESLKAGSDGDESIP